MKKILIIGASGGIGLEIIKQLSQEGSFIFGTYNKKSLENGENIKYYPLNILDDYPDFSFIPDNLDGMVYMPGSIHLKPFARIKSSDFLEDYKLQLIGAVRSIQAALPALKKSGNSSVVLFSTVAVQKGFNFHSLVASSKGAIEGLTRSLAAEFAPKIRFNCIAPSLTDTPLAEPLLNTEQKREAGADRHPMKRIGQPTDIASMVKFLLSDISSWMTGQILHVDGGMSAIKT